MDWIYTPSDTIWGTLGSAVLLFFVVTIVARMVGLRSFAKFTTFDFAFTVATGSTIAAALTSSNTTVVEASVGVIGLLGVKAVVALAQRYIPWVDNAVSNKPLLLMKGSEIIQDNMDAARISHSQLIAKLREANVIHFDQVEAVVLETTGDMSVLYRPEKHSGPLQEDLLLGVEQRRQ